MSSIVDNAEVEVLEAYPADRVWNVIITLPESIKGLKHNSNVSSPYDYSIYRIQSWTDETVDLNETMLVAANLKERQYKLLKGEDDSIPESVQVRMLAQARDIMFRVAENLQKK